MPAVNFDVADVYIADILNKKIADGVLFDFSVRATKGTFSIMFTELKKPTTKKGKPRRTGMRNILAARPEPVREPVRIEEEPPALDTSTMDTAPVAAASSPSAKPRPFKRPRPLKTPSPTTEERVERGTEDTAVQSPTTDREPGANGTDEDHLPSVISVKDDEQPYTLVKTKKRLQRLYHAVGAKGESNHFVTNHGPIIIWSEFIGTGYRQTQWTQQKWQKHMKNFKELNRESLDPNDADMRDAIQILDLQYEQHTPINKKPIIPYPAF